MKALTLIFCLSCALLGAPAKASDAVNTQPKPALSAMAASSWQLPMANLPAGIEPVVLIEGVAEYQLANGLQILLAPDPARSQTTVNMSYRVGARHESKGQTGMAHLFEHLLFRGSPNYPDPLAEFSRRGLAANGSTSLDLTNYYATFASDPDNLRWYLGWQADAMQNASLGQPDLDAEMTVVRNEMERGENSPFAVLMQQTTAAAYVWHPYGRSVIGARSDVENIGIAALRDFYETYYQPDNATLIITGNFDPLEVLDWIVKDFGAIARPQRSLPPEYTQEPVQQGARAVNLQRSGGSPIALLVYHLPQASNDSFLPLAIGTAMLADTPAGPLYQDLVTSHAATSIFGFARALNQPGFAIFGAQMQPTAAASEVLEKLQHSLEQSAVARLDQAGLERIRTAWLNNWQKTYDQPAALAAALSDSVAQGDWRLFFIEPLRLKELTLEQIQTQLSQWLLASNRTSGLYVPTPAPQDTPAFSPGNLQNWLKQLPTGQQRSHTASFDTSPQAIDAATRLSTLELANGKVQLALLPKPTPGQRVQVGLKIRFAGLEQLKGLNIVPGVTAAMFLRGTTELSRQAIDDKLNSLDAELAFAINANVLSVSMRTAREHLDELIDLAFHLLRHADFPADELEQIKYGMITGIENQAVSPAFMVRNTLERHAQPWAVDDPRYSPDTQQLLAYTSALTRTELLDFYQRFIGAGDIQLAAVGDFDADALTQQLSAALQGWHQAPPYQRIDDPYYAISPEFFKLTAPGKANAEYMAFLPLQIQDTDPRWPALLIANYILGGGNDSRLWQQVRVKDGLSYGIGSSVQASAFEPSAGFTIYASVASENALEVKNSIQNTLEQAIKNGFSSAQVQQAVKSLEQFFALSRSNDAYLTSQWLRYLDTGRSFAWQEQFLQRLQTLDATEVNAVLREFIRPAQLSIALAADFKD